MNPQDFLQTAQNLSGSQYEADMRSAISRAYYAALHTAFSALPEQRKPDLKAALYSGLAIISEGQYGNRQSV